MKQIKAWFEKWKNEFNEQNLDIRWRDEGEIYEQAILEEDEQQDVIIIDGKRRHECAKTAIQKLQKGGMIILDDSDRVNTSLEYQKTISILKNADLFQVDFYGFCPMNNYTKTTTIFFDRNFRFKSKFDVQPINGLGNLWSMSRRERKEKYNEQK